jgi:hypothetical protein
MALSTYTINKLADWWLRNQTFVPPANFYFSLHSAVSTAAAAGTEFSAGNYARVAVARSLANFSGTQGQGTTAVSSGTGGAIYNNIAINFGAPSVAWGTIYSVCIWDAPTGGNMLDYYNLGTPKQVVNVGDPVLIDVNSFNTTFTST